MKEVGNIERLTISVPFYLPFLSKQFLYMLRSQSFTKPTKLQNKVCFDWGIYHQPPRASWISPKSRVVLLGDAAHATAPFMGQGANMAMHDAFYLGQILLDEKISLPEGRVTKQSWPQNFKIESTPF